MLWPEEMILSMALSTANREKGTAEMGLGNPARRKKKRVHGKGGLFKHVTIDGCTATFIYGAKQGKEQYAG